MQRIHFEKLTSWPNTLLILTALTCIGIGLWGISGVSNYNWTKQASILGYLLLLLFFGKMFIHRNYVGLNSVAMIIRIDSFFGKTIRLPEVKEAFIDKDILFVTKKNGNHTGINISNIEDLDIKKLSALINSLAKAS